MAFFGEELFRRSPFKFWALAPCLVLGMAVILLPGGPGDFGHVAAVVLCELAGLLLLFSLWPYHDVPLVRRALAGLVALTYLAMLVEALARGADGLGAKIAFGLIGWPCVVYALRGRFRDESPIDPDEVQLPEARAEALAQIPRFLELWPRASAASVRFDLEVEPPADLAEVPAIETVWAEVLAVDERSRRVRVALPGKDGARSAELSLDRLSDWEIVLPDGSLEGHFTARALVALAAGAGWEVPARVRRRLRRCRSATTKP